MRVFRGDFQRSANIEDSLAERDGFEFSSDFVNGQQVIRKRQRQKWLSQRSAEQVLSLATLSRRGLPQRRLLERPHDRILAGAISRGMSEHFWIGIQMTGEVARGALPSEFLIEGRDDLLDRYPRVGLQNCRYQLRPPDLAVAVGRAQFIELRASGLLRPRPQVARRPRRASKSSRGFGRRESRRFEPRNGAHLARRRGPCRRRRRSQRRNLTSDASAQQLGDGSLIRAEQFECALESLQTLGQALDLLSARVDLILDRSDPVLQSLL